MTKDAIEIQHHHSEIGPIGIHLFDVEIEKPPDAQELRFRMLERVLSETRDDVAFLRARVRQIERTQYFRRFLNWVRELFRGLPD